MFAFAVFARVSVHVCIVRVRCDGSLLMFLFLLLFYAIALCSCSLFLLLFCVIVRVMCSLFVLCFLSAVMCYCFCSCPVLLVLLLVLFLLLRIVIAVVSDRVIWACSGSCSCS